MKSRIGPDSASVSGGESMLGKSTMSRSGGSGTSICVDPVPESSRESTTTSAGAAQRVTNFRTITPLAGGEVEFLSPLGADNRRL
jgi:hypothetical protein